MYNRNEELGYMDNTGHHFGQFSFFLSRVDLCYSYSIGQDQVVLTMPMSRRNYCFIQLEMSCTCIRRVYIRSHHNLFFKYKHVQVNNKIFLILKNKSPITL